jgi:outer membrane protein OmpA-like peptidoglycan-associated protein
MFWRKLLAAVAGGVALAGVSDLQLMSTRAEERTGLGGPLGLAAEFQSAVGDRVFFSEASAELGTRGRLALQAQAEWLLRYPHLTIVIEGHADDAGGVAHNLSLSRQRAEVVEHRLIQMGVAPQRIRTAAFGRERLIADCAAAACAAQNRRAVTIVGPPLVWGQLGPAPAPVARDGLAVRRVERRVN